VDTQLPAVLSASPGIEAKEVPATTRQVSITFSEPLEPGTVTAENFQLKLGSRALNPLTPPAYDPPTWTVRFIPAEGLLPGSRYTVAVSAAIQDLAGNRPANAITWSFSTEVPSVVATYPEAGAEGISIHTPALQIFFSGRVARQELEGFQLRARSLGESGAGFEGVPLVGLGADSSGTIISFAPRDGLRSFAEYEVVVGRQVLGELATQDWPWRFSTAGRLANPAQGGTVTNPGRTVELYFPPAALQEGTGEVAITSVDEAVLSAQTLQPDWRRVGLGYRVVAGESRLRKPATLTIRYAAEEGEGREADKVSIFRLEEGAWQRVGGTPAPAQRQVSAAVNSLGIYALLEDLNTPRGRLSLSPIECQPQAFDPTGRSLRAQTDISFELSAPADVTVRVYNLSGRLERVIVRDKPMAPGRALLTWDGRDEGQKVVSSGLYIVVVTAGKAQQEKVVAVVR